MKYEELIERRRSLSWPGLCTLADVGMDGPWVTPYQISSCSPTGPALVAFNWLNASAVEPNRAELLRTGYLRGIPFNDVLEQALQLAGMTRADVYMTQAVHLLPPVRRSGGIPRGAVEDSFSKVTKHELSGRRVIALGRVAAAACLRHGIRPRAVPHPSARGMSYGERAALIAAALIEAR